MRITGNGVHTIQLLEDTVDSSRAAAAAHGDIEFVGVQVRHGGGGVLFNNEDGGDDGNGRWFVVCGL